MRKLALWAMVIVVMMQSAGTAATVSSAGFKTLSETGQRAFQSGRFADAEAAFKQALAGADSLGSQADLAKAIAFTNLGATYMAQDKLAEAEQAYKQSLTLKEKALGKNHALVADSLNHYAACLRRQKRNEEAEAAQLRAELIQMQNLAAVPAASLQSTTSTHSSSPASEPQSERLAKTSYLQTAISRIVQQTLNDKEKMWNPETSEAISWKSDRISGARIASGEATYDFIKDMRYFEDRYRLTPAVVEDAENALRRWRCYRIRQRLVVDLYKRAQPAFMAPRYAR